MIHEHQRLDAEKYISYECKNLADYEDVKKKVEEKGEDSMEKVCIEGVLAAKYGFSAVQYNPSVPGTYGKGLVTRVGPFDLKSIM